jgi:hypothetical protein
VAAWAENAWPVHALCFDETIISIKEKSDRGPIAPVAKQRLLNWKSVGFEGLRSNPSGFRTNTEPSIHLLVRYEQANLRLDAMMSRPAELGIFVVMLVVLGHRMLFSVTAEHRFSKRELPNKSVDCDDMTLTLRSAPSSSAACATTDEMIAAFDKRPVTAPAPPAPTHAEKPHPTSLPRSRGRLVQRLEHQRARGNTEGAEFRSHSVGAKNARRSLAAQRRELS